MKLIKQTFPFFFFLISKNDIPTGNSMHKKHRAHQQTKKKEKGEETEKNQTVKIKKPFLIHIYVYIMHFYFLILIFKWASLSNLINHDPTKGYVPHF